MATAIADIINGELPKASHLRDEKFITAAKSLASDYGHKLVSTDINTNEKDRRQVTLKFERSVSGQEELDLSAEREPDDEVAQQGEAE